MGDEEKAVEAVQAILDSVGEGTDPGDEDDANDEGEPGEPEGSDDAGEEEPEGDDAGDDDEADEEAPPAPKSTPKGGADRRGKAEPEPETDQAALDARVKAFFDVLDRDPPQPPGAQPRASGDGQNPAAPTPGSAPKILTKAELDEIREQSGDAVANSIQALQEQVLLHAREREAQAQREHERSARQARADIAGFFQKSTDRWGTVEKPSADGLRLLQLATVFQARAGGPDACSNQEALETAAAVFEAKKRNTNQAAQARDEIRKSVEKRHKTTDLPPASGKAGKTPKGDAAAMAVARKFVAKG